MIPVGRCPAKIMLVNSAPSLNDIKENIPFSGFPGIELDRMLAEAGIQRSECFITHVLRTYPPEGDPEAFFAFKKKDITPRHVWRAGKMVLPEILNSLELLRVDIELCQPNVIVAFGNVALWALTGEWGITNWRSSILECTLVPGRKVIPIIPPSMIMKIWTWRTITVQDLRRVKRESQFPEINSLDYKFLIGTNYSEVMDCLNYLYQKVRNEPTLISNDIETRSGHIDCIGLGWSATEAICIPLMQTSQNLSVWDLEEETSIIEFLYKILTHPNCRVLGQNYLYDIQYIYRYWHFIPRLYLDTMIMQHSCFSSMLKSLAFLSSMYSPYHRYWKDEGSTWSTPQEERERWEYNCKDCIKTYELALTLTQVVESMGLKEVNEFQQQLCWPVLQSMIRGVRVDIPKRNEFAMHLMDEIAKREQFYLDILGHPLNPSSNTQMQALFKEGFRLKVPKDRKRGTDTYGDEGLRKMAAKEPLILPLVNKILEHRSIKIFLSTFINAPLDVDDRMRCMYSIAGTDTYRFASRKNAFGTGANLQNIPKGGEESEDLELPNIRTLYIPDPGMEFFDIDLDSADLRIVCWEADIPEMKQMIKEGYKVYVEVTKEYYHDPSMTKNSPQYKLFKSFCHGTNYLGTGKGLAERLGLTVHETEKLQQWYFGKFPRLKKWHEKIKRSVMEKRMVENIFGYRMYFFDRIQGTIMNQAVAWIPQSTVAIIINKAYCNIHNNLKEVEVLLQVHDSLAGQYPISKSEWCKKRIIEESAITLPFPGDPTVVPVGIKTSQKSWGDC